MPGADPAARERSAAPLHFPAWTVGCRALNEEVRNDPCGADEPGRRVWRAPQLAGRDGGATAVR